MHIKVMPAIFGLGSIENEMINKILKIQGNKLYYTNYHYWKAGYSIIMLYY